MEIRMGKIKKDKMRQRMKKQLKMRRAHRVE